MVQILPANRQKTFGQAILGGVAENLPGAIAEMQENAALKKNYGLDLAGIRDQNTRQKLIADQLAFGRKMKQAQAAQDVQLMQGEKPTQQKMTPEERKTFVEEERATKVKPPEFLEKRTQNRPDQEKEEQPPFGHAPQPETKGKKVKVLNPTELMQDAVRLANEMTRAGTPTKPEEAYPLARQINEDRKAYNQEVESDIEQQVKSQQAYGQKAVSYLKGVLEEPTGEQEAYFQRLGEEAAQNPKFNTSEAKINAHLATEAKNFKNTLANVKASLPPPRAGEAIKQTILGTSRDWDKRKNDYRVKLAPLLKAGLYDTARDLLSANELHPEEREGIIADLGENSLKALSKLPKMETGLFKSSVEGIVPKLGSYSPQQSEMVRENLRDVLTADPSTNLILLRKAYEEKGIDWQEFKDQLNDLIFKGEVKLNDDQFNHLDLLDKPPLDYLDKILHGLKLIGR